MWHWIQNALSKKRQQFFFDILILVSCIHVCSIVGAILYQSKRGIEQVSLIAPDIRGSTLVFVPLYKKIEQPTSQSSTSSIQKPHHQMNYDEFLDRQKKAESAKKSAPQKSVQKKAVPKTVPLKSASQKSVQKKVEPAKAPAQKTGALKIAPQKSALQKPVEKKPAEKSKSVAPLAATSLSNESVKSKKVAPQKVPAQKIAAQKSVAQKGVEKKSIMPQVLDQKKAQEKIEAPVEKIQEVAVEKTVEKAALEVVKELIVEKIPEQQIAEQKIEEVSPQEVVPQPIQEELVSNIADQQENVLPLIDMNDVTFVGVKDLEHLQLQQLVSGELAKHWKRPVGMENKICVVKIELHATGKIVNASIEKSSGVPMYDMAAKAAALKTTYPQEIWNKKLVIQF